MSKDRGTPHTERAPAPHTFDEVVAPRDEGRVYRTGTQGPNRDPSRKSALTFGVVTAIGTVLGTLAVLILAATGHPYRSAFLLGSGMILMGVLRAVWPGRPWFASRQKWLDVFVFVAVGAAVLYFAPWTATIAVT